MKVTIYTKTDGIVKYSADMNTVQFEDFLDAINRKKIRKHTNRVSGCLYKY